MTRPFNRITASHSPAGTTGTARVAEARVVPTFSECPHGRNRDNEWCEPCFRKEQRKRWGYSPWDYADFLGRANG